MTKKEGTTSEYWWCNILAMILLALVWFWLFSFYDMVWKHLENKKEQTYSQEHTQLIEKLDSIESRLP